MTRFLPQRLTLILWSFTLFMLIWNCDAVDSHEVLTKENQGLVRIIYNGMDQDGATSLASFTLVNDSTESVQYFAYDSHAMHYSTESLTDTGWAYLAWNWCGTGASYFPLVSHAQVDFYTGLPANSCTWRVVLNISDLDMTASAMLRSENIQYTAP